MDGKSLVAVFLLAGFLTQPAAATTSNTTVPCSMNVSASTPAMSGISTTSLGVVGTSTISAVPGKTRDLFAPHPDVPLWVYVAVLLVILGFITCVFVGVVVLWGRYRRHAPRRKRKGNRKPTYRLKSQNDLDDLANCDYDTATGTLQVVSTSCDLNEEDHVYDQVDGSTGAAKPRDDDTASDSISKPSFHYPECSAAHVTYATLEEVVPKSATEPPIPMIHLPPTASLECDSLEIFQDEEKPLPRPPIARRFTFEDGTFLLNYPPFNDPEALGSYNQPVNIYSSQYLMEHPEKQGEVEIATPTDSTRDMEMKPTTSTNIDSNHFTRRATTGSGKGPAGTGGDRKSEVEPKPTEPLQTHLQTLEEVLTAQSTLLPAGSLSHPDQTNEDVCDTYAVPIPRSLRENSEKQSRSNGAGAASVHDLQGPTSIFDDPSYLRGMMVRRQKTAPQLLWYENTDEDEVVCTPEQITRRAHSHGSLIAEEAISRSPPLGGAGEPSLNSLVQSEAAVGGVDALELVGVPAEELNGLDPDVATVWFGLDGNLMEGEAVTDV